MLRKAWKPLFGKKEGGDDIKRDKSPGKPKRVKRQDDTMRGGSLTRFRTDESYGQDGSGLLKDILQGGFQGLIKSRNPLKVPTNTLNGLSAGLK